MPAGSNSTAFGITATGGAVVEPQTVAGPNGSVVISYPTGTYTATGGTITTSGGNTIHTFTSSGNFVVSSIAIGGPLEALTPASRTITLSRTNGFTTATHSIDPTDELDFVINLEPLLEVGEEFVSVTIYILPTSAAQGFEIPSSGSYAVTEIDHANLMFWPRIDTPDRTASSWLGQGSSCGFEVTAVTDSTPPRIWQRTAQIRVSQK